MQRRHIADLCIIRLLRSHMKLKKNRPNNHWLKSQGHYLLCFSTSKWSEPIRFTCDMRLQPVTASGPLPKYLPTLEIRTSPYLGLRIPKIHERF